MKLIILPLVLGLSLAASALNAEAQTTRSLFGGVAKITLPPGATLEPFDVGDMKGAVVILSEKDWTNRVYIQRENVRKSLSDLQWRNKITKYYNDSFKKYKNVLTKKTLRGSGKQVLVDYEYDRKNEHTRDYSKYLRAKKGTQIQAYFYIYNTDQQKRDKQWKSQKARQMRAVVDSLRTP